MTDLATTEAVQSLHQRGDLGRAYQIFGDQLPNLLEDLNGVLVA